jgi:hypothetical protein
VAQTIVVCRLRTVLELGRPRKTMACPTANLLYSYCMEEREMIWRWVETWKEAGPKLEAIRHREIREADNLKVLSLLEGAFNQALRTSPLRPSSGMVEMQAWFAKLPR